MTQVSDVHDDEVWIIYSYRGEHGICCFEFATRREDEAAAWITRQMLLDQANPHRPEAVYHKHPVYTTIGFEDGNGYTDYSNHN